MKSYTRIIACRLCDSKILKLVFDFKSTPIGNDLLNKKNLHLDISKFPLAVNQCIDCGHHQLSISIDNKILYAKNYTYLSGVSKVFVNYFQKYSQTIVKKLRIKKNDFVLDIGSNDGTLLHHIKKISKCSVLGIDPASLPVQVANKNNVNSIKNFFNYKLSKKLKKNYPIPKLITTHNTFAHVADLNDFFKSIDNISNNDTTVVIEIGYWLEVVKNNWFDTIYHEHHDYHSLKPLVKFFHKFNFNVSDFKITKPQGGSLMMILKKNKNNFIYKKIKKQIEVEENYGLYRINHYKKIYSKLKSTKLLINKILLDYNKKKLKVCAFGSPTKAVTLLSFFNVKKNFIQKIYEDNHAKCGLFNPYNKIPIVSSKNIKNDKPDLIIILAWNFYKSILKNNKKFISKNGIFLVPLPKPFFVK